MSFNVKALRPPVYILQFILTGLSLLFVLIAARVHDEQIVFWPATFGIAEHGDIKIPLLLGFVEFKSLFIFLAFIPQYLAYEFYGYRTALYSVIANVLAVIVLTGIPLGLKKLLAQTPFLFDESLITLFPDSLKNSAALVIAYGAAMIFLYTLSSIIKKMTFSYFMFVRYLIAVPLGFATWIGLTTLFRLGLKSGIETLAMASFPLLLQTITTLVAALIPIYLLRLLLGLFRGRLPKALRTQDKLAEKNPKPKKRLFGPKTEPVLASSAPPPAEDPQQEVTPHVAQPRDDMTERIRPEKPANM